jgi:hypothetical protein
MLVRVHPSASRPSSSISTRYRALPPGAAHRRRLLSCVVDALSVRCPRRQLHDPYPIVIGRRHIVMGCRPLSSLVTPRRPSWLTVVPHRTFARRRPSSFVVACQPRLPLSLPTPAAASYRNSLCFVVRRALVSLAIVGDCAQPGAVANHRWTSFLVSFGSCGASSRCCSSDAPNNWTCKLRSEFR